MNEKERIIELVKQNVITMDEALRLLEASAQSQAAPAAGPSEQPASDATVTPDAKSTESTEPATPKGNFDSEQFKASVQDAIDKSLKFGQEIIYNVQHFLEEEKEDTPDAEATESTEATEAPDPEALAQAAARRQALEAELKTEGEALLIAKQRLREFEILAELDELSDELKAQQDEVAAEVLTRGARVDQLQAELNTLKQPRRTDRVYQRLNDFTDRVEAKLDRASDTMDQAGQRIDSEANRLGRVISQVVSGAFKVARDGIRAGARAYNRLGNEWEHSFTFDPEGLQVLDLKLVQGDVRVTRAHVDAITVDVKASFFGKIPNPTLEDFQAHSVLSLDEGTLLCHLTSGQVAADIEITLPDQDLATLRIETTHGDIDLDGVTANEIYLTTVNGDVDLNGVTADLLDYHSTNGDFVYQDADVKRLSLETTNGDCRVVGAIGDVAANLISGDLLLTKRDEAPASMKLNTVSGDVKVAIPAQLSLEGTANSSSGDVAHRYSHLDVETRRRHALDFQRLMTDANQPVHLDITTISGDIRLKDTDL